MAINYYIPLFLIAAITCNVFSQELRISVRDRWMVDSYGRVRIFHGFNSVYKSFPWYDQQIMNQTRLDLFKEWGLNCVRLGMMWKGLEPQRDQYNETYLAVINDAVQLLKTRGIYSLLDSHQDVFSAADSVCPSKICYNGIPDWVSDKFSPPFRAFPWPFKQIDFHNWPLAYLTSSVSHAFQQFYDNKDGVLEQFGKFWKKVADEFKNETSILGYELMNEPWAGDIYSNPERLLPGYAGREVLLPVYNFLFSQISSVDDHTNIFYEPVTWAIYSDLRDLGTGFEHLPGGKASENRAVLSYHYYCWPLFDKDMSTDYPFYLRILCDKFFGSRIFSKLLKDVSISKGSLFLTEFGLCAPDNRSSSMNTIECDFVLDKADEHMQSWMYWDSSFFLPSGAINTPLLESFARPYSQATSGIPQHMHFDIPSKTFSFSFLNDPSITPPTEIFLPKLHYPSRVEVTVSPIDVIFHHDTTTSLLLIHNIISQQVVSITVKPTVQLDW